MLKRDIKVCTILDTFLLQSRKNIMIKKQKSALVAVKAARDLPDDEALNYRCFQEVYRGAECNSGQVGQRKSN